MGTKAESSVNNFEELYCNYLGMAGESFPGSLMEVKREQSFHLFESQLSTVKTSIDRMEKKVDMLEVRFKLLEEKLVTMDYIDYKMEELNEWLEDEYSLLFDDLHFLKKGFVKLLEKSAQGEKTLEMQTISGAPSLEKTSRR